MCSLQFFAHAFQFFSEFLALFLYSSSSILLSILRSHSLILLPISNAIWLTSSENGSWPAAKGSRRTQAQPVDILPPMTLGAGGWVECLAEGWFLETSPLLSSAGGAQQAAKAFHWPHKLSKKRQEKNKNKKQCWGHEPQTPKMPSTRLGGYLVPRGTQRETLLFVILYIIEWKNVLNI